MSPEVVVSMLSTAVAALFGALVFTMRQQREDWKSLYEREAGKHEETRKEASLEVRKALDAIREIGEFVKGLPRRRNDEFSESRSGSERR